MPRTSAGSLTALRALRARGAVRLTRAELAHVLGVKPNTIDQGRSRGARGMGRAVELLRPSGYFGRTPYWDAEQVEQLIAARAESWSRHPAESSAESLQG